MASYITWYGSDFVKIGGGNTFNRAKAGKTYNKECFVLFFSDKYTEFRLRRKFQHLQLKTHGFPNAGREIYGIDDSLIKFIEENLNEVIYKKNFNKDNFEIFNDQFDRLTPSRSHFLIPSEDAQHDKLNPNISLEKCINNHIRTKKIAYLRECRRKAIKKEKKMVKLAEKTQLKLWNNMLTKPHLIEYNIKGYYTFEAKYRNTIISPGWEYDKEKGEVSEVGKLVGTLINGIKINYGDILLESNLTWNSVRKREKTNKIGHLKIGYVQIRNRNFDCYDYDDKYNLIPKKNIIFDGDLRLLINNPKICSDAYWGGHIIDIETDNNLILIVNNKKYELDYVEMLHIIGNGVNPDFGRSHGSGYYATRNAYRTTNSLI